MLNNILLTLSSKISSRRIGFLLIYSLRCLVYIVLAQDCIPGEQWLEYCKKCLCLKNGTQQCVSFNGPCFTDQCVSGTFWFSSDYRCHCSIKNSRPHSICVHLEFQKDLNSNDCVPNSYMYDSCTMCYCDEDSNTTVCRMVANCSKTNGGICHENESYIESCHICYCTKTKFRLCYLSEKCFNNATKPGECPKKVLSTKNILCMFLRRQECYGDYSCPGRKKCCSVDECYLRCIDPD